MKMREVILLHIDGGKEDLQVLFFVGLFKQGQGPIKVYVCSAKAGLVG